MFDGICRSANTARAPSRRHAHPRHAVGSTSGEDGTSRAAMAHRMSARRSCGAKGRDPGAHQASAWVSEPIHSRPLLDDTRLTSSRSDRALSHGAKPHRSREMRAVAPAVRLPGSGRGQRLRCSHLSEGRIAAPGPKTRSRSWVRAARRMASATYLDRRPRDPKDRRILSVRHSPPVSCAAPRVPRAAHRFRGRGRGRGRGRRGALRRRIDTRANARR
jgi:hypothetical protein